MAYKIFWSEKAVDDLKSISEYLKKEWGDGSELKFKKKLSLRIDLLSKFPEMHKASTLKPNYRLSVLSKRISIIYSFNGSMINILRLFDNRKNPNKLI